MKTKKVFNFKEDWPAAALILALILAFLYQGLFPLYGPQVLSDWQTDTATYFFHTRSYGFETIRDGAIPKWNPYIYSGTPFIATFQSGIFYPFNLVFLFLPLPAAINWNIAFHLFLSGIFTYYLLKYYGVDQFGSAIAGIAYTFSAPQIMHIYAGHLNVLTAMVWAPLMFLFLDRLIRGEGWRYGIYLSFTIAVLFLAGQPQYLFYSLIALSLYLLFLILIIQLKVGGVEWSKIGSKFLVFSAFIALGIALSAVQIFPTMEMTRYSTRENLSYEWVSIFSFPPENLITFLIPDFFGNMMEVPYWGKNYLWEMTGYVGIIPLMLAVVAIVYARNRVAWFFAGLAVFSVILALGKYTPLLKILYSYAPGFNLFRGNSKFIFLNALSLAVLSGFGADALCRKADELDKRFRLGIVGLGLLITAVLLAMYAAFDEAWFRRAINNVVSSNDLFNNPAPFMQRGFEIIAAASFRSGMLWTLSLLISGILILFLCSYKILKGKILISVIVLIIVIDLFAFGMRYMVTFDSSESYWDKEVISQLKQDKGPFRVIAPGMDVNSGMVAGIETLGGYDTIMVRRYSDFINFSQGIPIDRSELWINVRSINRVIDMLNAKYLVLRSNQSPANPALKLIFDNGNYRIYQNTNALPRAFVVHNAKVIRDRDSIFQELASPEFNPTSYAIVEEELEIPFNLQGQQSPTPRFIEYSPNRVVIDAYLNTPGLLILGDTYYPGWEAFVDGKEVKVFPANYVMRGVVLPEGRHTVEFRYEPLSFKIGAIISLVTLLFIVGFLVWDWRRNPHEPCLTKGA